MIQDEDLVSEDAYVLRDYLQEPSEANLNGLSWFVGKLLDRNIGPEGILAVHLEVVHDMMKELPAIVRPRLIALSFQCLSETLTGYGLVVTERIKSKKVEYNRLRECTSLVEERARELLSKFDEREKALLALHAIAVLVSEVGDFRQKAELILHRMLEILGVDAGEIYLWDKEKKTLVYSAGYGLSDRFAQDSKNTKRDWIAASMVV